MEESKFRLQNRRFLLTYSQKEFDKEIYENWFKDKFKKTYTNIWLRCGRELHQDGNPHMHVIIDFGKIFQSINPRIFDYEDHHPNIQKITTAIHWANSKKYIGKVDADNKDLVEETEAFRRIANCESLEYALTTGIRPMDAKILFEGINNKKFEIEPVKKPKAIWIDVVEELKEGNYESIGYKYDPYRTIIWLCDKTGCTKKSWYAKWLHQESKDTLYLSDICNYNNAMMKVDQAVMQGWTGKYIIINLPRTFNHDTKMYQVIETLKDGWCDTSKYQSKPPYRIPDNVFICVLSNEMPHITALSRDKWKILELDDREIKMIDEDVVRSSMLISAPPSSQAGYFFSDYQHWLPPENSK